VQVFRIERTLELPQTRDRVFPFFADPSNLETITPPWLNFRILTPAPVDMAVGARIDYQLRLHGIPLRWQSEITAWEPPFRFIDEQRRGPYQLWIHEHRFVEEDGRTTIHDRVEYAVPGGALINKLFVVADLKRVFDYRHSVLQERFGFAT
jgi:ligand-binding SRPBCC domain-containing protein